MCSGENNQVINENSRVQPQQSQAWFNYYTHCLYTSMTYFNCVFKFVILSPKRPKIQHNKGLWQIRSGFYPDWTDDGETARSFLFTSRLCNATCFKGQVPPMRVVDTNLYMASEDIFFVHCRIIPCCVISLVNGSKL